MSSQPKPDPEVKPPVANPAPAHSAHPPAPAENADDRLHTVERMFPFVLRSRILVVGRENLQHAKRKLHFVLITNDLSANSQKQVLRDFAHYPVVKAYSSADLERFFNVRGTKVVGFRKSGLAQSIYAELKGLRLNRPALSPGSTPRPPNPPPE